MHHTLCQQAANKKSRNKSVIHLYVTSLVPSFLCGHKKLLDRLEPRSLSKESNNMLAFPRLRVNTSIGSPYKSFLEIQHKRGKHKHVLVTWMRTSPKRTCIISKAGNPIQPGSSLQNVRFTFSPSQQNFLESGNGYLQINFQLFNSHVDKPASGLIVYAHDPGNLLVGKIIVEAQVDRFFLACGQCVDGIL